MTSAVPDPNGRIVLLAGGWMHEPGPMVDAIGALAADRRMRLDVVTDPALVAGTLSPPDPPPELLVVGACWFSMADRRYSAEQRTAWAVVGDEGRHAAIAAVVDAGVPVLALHTAVICFDDWPDWGDLLGGRWDWGTSGHPPPGPVSVGPAHGAPVDFGPFTVIDEEYRDLVVSDRVDLVATSDGGHPMAWLHESGARRAAVDLLGHDARSLTDPGHRSLLSALLDHLLSGTTAGSEATVERADR